MNVFVGLYPRPYSTTVRPSKLSRKFSEYEQRVLKVRGCGDNGHPGHIELKEIMYLVCEEAQWWDWRLAKFGQSAFPKLPLS
jgi:hypothetical protein